MKELFKSISVVLCKQGTKAALVAQGVPDEVASMTAEVAIDALAATVNRALNRNDAAAQEAMDEIRDSMVVELAAKRESYWGGRAPSKEDVDHTLVRFATRTRTAGSHRKRWILFNALHNTFRPEFYNDGLSQILWKMVEELEYPDLIFLEDVMTCFDFPNDLRRHPVGLRMVDEKYVQFSNEHIGYKFAMRLEAQGLLLTEDLNVALGNLRPTGAGGGALRGNRMIAVAPTAIARHLRQFALEELWREEPEEGADDPEASTSGATPP